jgi:aminoglycoside phosphotransferase (APT) family kinase protein
LLSAWVDPCAAEGPEYVQRAIEVADRIAATPEPPGVERDASSWRAPRRTVVTRAARNISGGVPLRLWLAARRQAGSLPHPRTVAHGDFYPRNVLWARSGIHVVDWEYAGWAPRHTDLLRLWSILRRRDDRDRVISSVLADADDQERARVGSLLLWLSLRLLGENLSAARANRNAADLAHARAMVPEASRLARRLGAWPL